jgi:hypothetical protein
VAAPPDPATPGLLDLLTVAALGSPRTVDDDAGAGARPAGRAPRTDSGSRRLWVEVEASAR